MDVRNSRFYYSSFAQSITALLHAHVRHRGAGDSRAADALVSIVVGNRGRNRHRGGHNVWCSEVGSFLPFFYYRSITVVNLLQVYYSSGESITDLLQDSYRRPDVHLRGVTVYYKPITGLITRSVALLQEN